MAAGDFIRLVREMAGEAMSLKATSWAWEIPTKEIGMTNKFVLLALADYANQEGVCFPSQSTLGDKVDLSERSVRTALGELEALGLISRESRSSTGGRRSDSIRLTFSSPCNRKNLPVAQPEIFGSATGSPLPVATSILNQSDITRNRKDPVDIYAAYPKHVAKEAALKAIARALKRISFDELLISVQAFALAVDGSDKDLLPHPATWFNSGCWMDDRSTWKPRKRFNQQFQQIANDPEKIVCRPGELAGIDLASIGRL